MTIISRVDHATAPQLINFADDVVESLYPHLPGDFRPQDLQTIVPRQDLDSISFAQKLEWLKLAISNLENKLHNGEISK